MKYKKKDKIIQSINNMRSFAKNIIKTLGIHLHGTRGKQTRVPRGNKKY